MYLFIVTDWSKVKENCILSSFKSLLGFSYITRENEARFLMDL